MTRFQVLIPDNVDQKAIDLLSGVAEIDVVAPGKLSQDELKAQIGTAHAIIIRSGVQITADVLDAAPNLKAIARAGVGVDNVDLEAATARGVVVMNTPGGNTISTAEHTFGLMLALARHLAEGVSSLKAGRWDRKKFVGVELKGKTLGLVGFGRIGRAVAVRARAFDMAVLAYDPYLDTEVFEEFGVDGVTLDELFERSDFISLHTLITDETRAMIDAESIARMKDGVRIINAARGALINDDDLAAAIKGGKVAGAALDVYVDEPPSDDHPLVNLPEVVCTPHLAASTSDAQITVAVEAAELVIDALLKNRTKNVVNAAVLEAR